VLDQSWPAFDAAVAAGAAYAARPAGGVTRAAFPVRLGDAGHVDDGLIGYFIDDGSPEALRRFAAPAAATANAGVEPADPAAVSLHPVAAGDAGGTLTVMMLVDPRGSVHATTGVLPAKRITIPGRDYDDALRRLAVSTLCAPVLTGPAGVALPVPLVPGFGWSWVAADQSETAQPGGAPAQRAAPWPARLHEGWLKLAPSPAPDAEGSDGHGAQR
jgi:hypothetical protein